MNAMTSEQRDKLTAYTINLGDYGLKFGQNILKCDRYFTRRNDFTCCVLKENLILPYDVNSC